ncbi:MAG: M23 family metallopeptidase [bacterium]
MRIQHPASLLLRSPRGLGGRSNGIWFLLVLLGSGLQALAQPGYPKGYFRSPVDFVIFLSGSYGETRTNHFHSGIDIRTNGEIGKPVYAAADGYVSRVFVSPYGFGKALYINHAAGYTTVYGHLDRFTGAIASYVREQQYRKESFSLDMEVPTEKIKVKKGELVGYSGNSGSSVGPHLHFEIRDARNQEPLDPIAFGIPLQDKTRPQILTVRIYPFDDFSMVNFVNRPLSIQAVAGSNGYFLQTKDTIRVSGNIFFGIEAFDCQDQSTLQNGIKSVELKMDGQTVFRQAVERFAFADTRYVNSVIDYALNNRTKQRVLRSYIAPGNTLDIYQDVVNRGMFNFVDDRAHKITYIVKDGMGNVSTLSFWVKSHPPPPGGARPLEPKPMGTLFSWDRPNQYHTDDIRFDMPARALYEDIDFTCQTHPPFNGSSARVYEIHNEETPIQLHCDLAIRAEKLPASLQGKALVVKLEKNKFVSQGGKYSAGFVTTRIREFGEYTVSVDTTAPKITPVNIFNNKNISRQGNIVVTISDDLSGISSYRGTLNDQWILMDFDAKRNRLAYLFDSRLKPGVNKFHLVVTDGVGNRTEYSVTLIR